MAVAIRMPQPGQMTEECTVLQWFKAEGDTVAKGDPLFEIETDKSNMEIEAFTAGVLLRIDAPVGATVPVDAVVAWIGQVGEALPPPGAAQAPAAPGPIPVAAALAPAAPVRDAPVPTASPGPVPAPAPRSSAPAARIAISPRARRSAAQLGVEARTIVGTGPGGRVVERDVIAAKEAASALAPASIAPGPPAAAGAGEPLSRMRQTIARRLTQNTSVPTFDVTVAVDMTDLLGLRAQLKAIGSGISVTDFVHAATVQALGEHPLLNASTDGASVWRHEHVHLGVAVSVPAGLLVPVVRDADLLSVSGLHDRTVAVVTAAREGRLGPDELSGSTFTVTNMGMFGVERFTAIINPGESAILAVSSVTPEPRAHGGGIAIRQIMRITLTADHRLIDGALGAEFVNAVRRRLEDAAAFRDQVPTG
jgi:pyruvate dehydrogenase E2 component (dihydrolipoamide acetyltransferase)